MSKDAYKILHFATNAETFSTKQVLDDKLKILCPKKTDK